MKSTENNSEQGSKGLLQSHNLRTTGCRQGILDILNQSAEALTENEIKSLLESHYDRTTIYRSFKTLLDNNLIHKIVVDNLMVKYALNSLREINPEHAHFYCKHCEKLVCIEHPDLEAISLPAGFEANETEVIVKGTCQTCSVR